MNTGMQVSVPIPVFSFLGIYVRVKFPSPVVYFKFRVWNVYERCSGAHVNQSQETPIMLRSVLLSTWEGENKKMSEFPVFRIFSCPARGEMGQMWARERERVTQDFGNQQSWVSSLQG